MGRMRLLLAVCSLSLFLFGCATTAKSRLVDPSSSKCYAADSTPGITREAYAEMFRTLPTAGYAFPPCDSSHTAQVRIRPVASGAPAPWVSYGSLGIDLSTAAAGIGLMAAMESPLPLLLATIQVTPQASIIYSVESTDTTARDSLQINATEPAWFKSRDDALRSALILSGREISSRLFGVEHPLEERRWGRMGIEPASLTLNAVRGDLTLSIHAEKFLPRNLAIHAMAFTEHYSDFGESYYGGQAGLRRYFFGDHARLFLGLEPFFQYGNEYYFKELGRLRVTSVALPVTFGYLWQGDLIFTEASFGLGPGYAWVESNDSGIKGKLGNVVLGSLTVGFMF